MGNLPGDPLRIVTVPALVAIRGLVHGFEQRLPAVGVESRDQTRERVRLALAPQGHLLLLHQTHETLLLEAPWEGRPEGDASLARKPGFLLGIETADCLPLLFVDPEQKTVAAAHAGWRGTAAGIAASTLEALLAHGSRPEDVLVALGPCIGPCCYEVGDDLRSAFGDLATRVFRPGPKNRPHLDIRLANVTRLLGAGVAPQHIHHVADCTACNPGLYHSYRRDGRGGGRMISWVGFESS